MKFGDDALARIARELGVAVGHDKTRLKREVALRLYERRPDALKTLLEDYKSKVMADDMERALELLGTFWIDPGASTPMLKFCRVLDRRPVFAINGALFYFTPEAYVRQVCCWQTPWPVQQTRHRGRPRADTRGGIRSCFLR